MTTPQDSDPQDSGTQESEPEIAARLIADGWHPDDARHAAALEHGHGGCLHQDTSSRIGPSPEPDQTVLDLPNL